VQAIREWGAVSPNEVKLITRAGKGLCTGRCCQELVAQLVADQTRKGAGDLPPPSVRPPVRPVAFGAAVPPESGAVRLPDSVLSLQTTTGEGVTR
jgi:hypothetical protein